MQETRSERINCERYTDVNKWKIGHPRNNSGGRATRIKFWFLSTSIQNVGRDEFDERDLEMFDELRRRYCAKQKGENAKKEKKRKNWTKNCDDEGRWVKNAFLELGSAAPDVSDNVRCTCVRCTDHILRTTEI